MKVTWKITLLALAVAIAITGCKVEDVAKIFVQTPADYATRSNEDYSLNTYGLVTAENAAKLITDWKTNKPAGKRNLYIMQFGNIYGFAAREGYIKSDPAAGVYVFDRTAGCTDDGDYRFDGVTAMPKPVFTIKEMDDAFAYYGIDPDQDVIMLALGSPVTTLSGSAVSESGMGEFMAGVARMWYTLTYWGFPQKSIMVLNGQASYVLDPAYNQKIADMNITRSQIFTALQSTPPTNPVWKSISTVKVDGTILQATMKDMMNVVTLNSTSDLILDARSTAEYNGTAKKSKTEYSVCGPDHNETCFAAFEGHIKGAQNILYTNVLITDDNTTDISGDGVINYKDSSMTFKPLATLDGLFAAKGYTAGKNVYTYCRTGTKASLLSFTSAAVLGYKTRMYDGSWIQWGKLANKPDTYGITLVPFGNKWLTDVYSEAVNYNVQSYVSPLRQAPDLNLSADDTNLIIYTDKLAK